MSDKFLERILRGTSDANISFDQMCQLLRRMGFSERIRGSHHIYTKEGVEEILKFAAQRCKGETLSGETGTQHNSQIQTWRRR